jgi:signal transduction histidine kinase
VSQVLATALGLLATLAAPCEHEPALRPGPDGDRVPIEGRFAVLEDAARALAIDEVARPPACARFRLVERADFAVRGGGRHFVRFRLDPGSERARDWLMYFPIANFERACLHWPLAGGGRATSCVAPGALDDAGVVRHNRLLFRVPEALDPARPAFLELDSRPPQTLRGALVRTLPFLAADTRAQFAGGLFNGLLFATVLYNLIFFLAARDRASLFFALHVAGLGIAMLGFEGRGRELWPWLGALGSSLPTFMLGTAFLFGCLCGRDFLLTPARAPRLDGALKLALAPAIASLPLAIVDIDAAEQTSALAALAFVVALVAAAAALARRGDRPALYLLLGLSAFLAGLLGVSLRTLGIAAVPDAWGVPLTRAGLVVASIAISAGLGRRVIELRRERDRSARAVEALEASLRQREQMAAMGALVLGVAHEVRNPLFGISSTADALEARVGHEAVSPHLATLRAQVERLGKLMNDLLEYGRPQDLERTPEDLASVVAEAGRACQLTPQGARIETRAPDALPAALVDRKRVVQVIQNLIENALRHSPPGAPVRVELEPFERDGERLVRVTVRDSGPGFEAADLPHVFEPFFTRRRGGTGLGLSIVRKIVEEHGGRVEARNADGGGALVEVWLPVAPRPPA